MPQFLIRVSTPKREDRWHWVKEIEGSSIRLVSDRDNALRFVSRSEAEENAKKIPGLTTNVIRVTGPNEVKKEVKARFVVETHGWLPLENVMVAEKGSQIRVGRLVSYGMIESVIAFSHQRGEQPGWVEESVETAALRKIEDGWNRRLRQEAS